MVIVKKSILITGCSTGIGLDAAQTLSARGYQVFACARKTEDVKALQAQGLNAFKLDLTDINSMQITLSAILKETGGTLDYLFNNGAYGQPGALEDLPTQALREQFETNLFGWHELTRLVIPIMREQGGGRIIQCSSILGFVCMPYRGAYNASKYALEGLTDTLRMEVASANIQVILLEPGPIESAFRKNALAAFKKNIDAQQSVHYKEYKKQEARLASGKTSTAFTLKADAVTKALIHALESKHPKVRYRITTPTKVFAFLKRVLPSRLLDKLLKKG